MRVFYSDHYTLDLPEGHRFPKEKYALLRQALRDEGIVTDADLRDSPLASREELLRAHTAEYVDAVLGGTLDAKRQRRIGFPWSATLVDRSRASVGGQLAAARGALEDGIAGNLAGGTHHAHADFGSGYCVFNDIAVAALTLLAERRIERAAIVDLDVHQGDGNAAILGDDARVFIFSMHGATNFPFVKVPSTLDVALPDGTGDDTYLARLDEALPAVLAFAPDLVFYQAGVDPLAEDRLGKLSLTHAGLYARDLRVLRACRDRRIPVALSLGGGYARPISASVEAYANTYRAARAVFG